MPRSQSENENVQFVQELAEVDGPFESPININFRDLTKLELPALVWNRGDTRPKKMKITNTGHTVIISGKWKSERPYLTGGPLTGKYVFSQIHFHWGQDNLRGSEHQVCGEGYPLEMHVAHFKTEYLTQECALREKDGMVVVVYLFKLQEEPNNSLKKIINLLPCVKQASTSHAIDPRPILSLCNPFTEDYFMYWGSVVTSTCAHILLWVICREPFGISREQVNEFRKIMDLSQQPICRNSRDIQPLHKRNVFHVNASQYLDEPLLPVKKILGCYCKASQDNVNLELKTDCNCQFSSQNQEEVEGRNAEYPRRSHCISSEGMQALNEKSSLPSACFANQTIVVQTATVHSVSVVLKRFDSDPVDHSCGNCLQEVKSQDNSGKLTSQSCCFFSTSDTHEIHTDKRKIRNRKRPFNSLRAFSQIMNSLEALKSHTFKKLKEIESINQEIKGIKPLFHDAEDKQWLRKIEKMMAKKKGFTIKTSQGCVRELKKLAKECNFDKFFDTKTLPEMDDNEEVMRMNGEETEKRKGSNSYTKKREVPTKPVSSDRVTLPETTQKLIQSFFEDIKDSDEIEEMTKKDPNLEGFCCKPAEDVNSVSSVGKGYITQNMFKLGKLGDRFFTEVTAEDAYMDKDQNEYKKPSEKLLVLKELNEQKSASWSRESQKIVENEERTPEKIVSETKKEPLIPLHRANVSIAISKASLDQTETLENLYQRQDSHLTEEERFPSFESISTRRLIYRHNRRHTPSSQKTFEKIFSRKLLDRKNRELLSLANERFVRALERKAALEDVQLSSSNLSTESMETPSMIIAKFHKKISRKGFWPFRRSSDKISPKRHGKISCKKFEGYYIEEKDRKYRKSKRRKRRTWRTISRSKDWRALILNPKLRRAKFKLQIGSTTSNTTTESDLEKPISPERKKLRLENKKLRSNSSRETKFFSDDELTDEEIKRSPKDRLSGHQENKKSPRRENLEEKEAQKSSDEPSERKNSIKSYRQNKAAFEISCKTPRSAASRNFSDRQGQKVSKVFERSPNGETSETEPRIWRKLLPKNQSQGIMSTSKTSTQCSQELPVEHLDDRRKTEKQAFGPRNPQQSKESNRGHPLKQLYSGISNVTYRNSEGEQKETICSRGLNDGPDTLSPNEVKCNVGYLTTSSLVDDELLPNNLNQEKITKIVLLKRCDAEKYTFLEKIPINVNFSLKNPNGRINEILHQTDSNISFSNSKGDADPVTLGNKDLQTSVSYTTVKKNPTSRPHSAETLNFLMKTIKRKYKKRPHCCKRNSIHYIRKNSSKKFEEVSFRKHSQENEKVTSLKETRSLSLKHTEKENVSLSETSGKPKNERYEKKRKVPISKLLPDFKKEKIPKPGTADRKTAPSTPKSALVTPKQAPSTAPPKPTGANEKPTTATQKPGVAVKKPVSNFIKLNKQLAGKYKKRAVSPEKKPVKAKAQQSQTKQKLATTQSKMKLQRKKGKIPIPKRQFQTQATSQTLTPTENDEKLSPKAQETEILPENRIRSLGCLKLDRFNGSQNFAFRGSLFYSE